MRIKNIPPYFFTEKMLFALACAFVLLINGAIPFIFLPTTGQAFWVTGFSQSFANNALTSIHAHNIGAPQPAAMAFGLAGAWTASLFIRLGMHAADSYTLMIALWLTVAFYGAYKMARSLGATPKPSILAALTWGTMPMIWNHAGYSMLSIGIALLPLYFWAAANLFFSTEQIKSSPSKPWPASIVYLIVCLISVFMDGYTFMMFAAGASILGLFTIVTQKANFSRFIIHGICFSLAYILFSIYISKKGFSAAHLDFFRGWGADISFFLKPTSGTHWFADLLGWSTPRSTREYFGDSSVWITTFCLPLALGALSLSFFTKKPCKTAFIAIAVFGFYMSLGPSFKFYSQKPTPETPDLMASEYAIAPTGTSILSAKLPGFQNMRASYRWAALGCLGAWVLLVIGMSGSQRKIIILSATGMMLAVSLLNLPNLPRKFDSYQSYRNQFLEVDKDLLAGMKSLLNPGEKVVFLPWGNDFLLNYLASSLDIITYNIGGDKNNQEARKHWPSSLAGLPMRSIHDDFAGSVINLLARADADAVVLSYVDMLQAAHQWPSPSEYKDKLGPILIELEDFEYIEIFKEKYYSIIRLKDEFSSERERQKILSSIPSIYCISPVCLRQVYFTEKVNSQVGAVRDGKLFSTGKAGFLHYGPYISLDSGDYLLTIQGKSGHLTNTWIDVTSQRGSKIHGKFLISSSQIPSEDVIFRSNIHLEEFAQDIEVRVYVGAGDQVTLSGYELSQVSHSSLATP